MLYQKNSLIGPYRAAFPHKKGYYAETYRVKDTAGTTLFLKLIDPSRLGRWQVDNDGNIIETLVAAQAKHPNLCRLHDVGSVTEGGRRLVYMVTDFVSGETLAQRISRKGKLSVYEIKQVARSVLSALHSLHTQSTPIIHNEVTLQNVMLNMASSIPDLRLIDFGHAQFLDRSIAKPELADLNPFCLASERFTGAFSVQSDIFSVGVMMHQLLYGELPWFTDTSGLKTGEKVEAVIAARERALATKQVDTFELDDQLRNTIAKALSPDPDDRFQSAEEMTRAIDGELTVEHPQHKRRVASNDKTSTSKAKATHPQGPGFAAVAGMQDLKDRMRTEVIEPLEHPEEYKRYGITIPNGMLLYGPPGCGKTFFAKHFAEEVGFNFVICTPATLKSRWVNATQENIAQMFADAEKNAPTIIFIDEINELVPNRESNVHEMSRGAVNEMLAQMDNTGRRGVFVIGATNYPHMIDPAILRAGRLDHKFYVGLPDSEARIALFRLLLKERPLDLGISYKRLAQLSENYVSADLQLIVNNASRVAMKAHKRIGMRHLEEAIVACRPSLSPEEIKQYESIRRKMEGTAAQPDGRPKIGFT